MLQQIMSGLEAGSWYAVIGLAVVVVMKATDVPNFAAVELGLLATFVAYTLLDSAGLPFWPAVLVGLVTGVVAGVVIDALFMRPLAGKGHFPLLLMTIGLSVALSALIAMIWGQNSRSFPAPWSDRSVEIFGTTVTVAQLITIGFGIVVVIALERFFRTPIGIRMRAVAENRTTARLMGVSPRRVTATAWAIGGGLSAAAVMLQVQSTTLSSSAGSSLIIYAFVAATLGGFSSLIGTFVGGLLLGVLQNLAGHFISTSAQSAVALLVVMAVLLTRPDGFTGGMRVRDV